MPNCDWGRPCECKECVPRPGETNCKCGAISAYVDVIRSSDRYGNRSIKWNALCSACVTMLSNQIKCHENNIISSHFLE